MLDDVIVFTGWGAVSSLGVGCEALFAGMDEGRDGMRPLLRFSTANFDAHLAGTVPGHDGPLDPNTTFESLRRRFALDAAIEALGHAELRVTGPGTKTPPRPRRIGIVMGASPLDESWLHELVSNVGDALALSGPRITICTACSASTNAVGLGADLLRRGDCDAVLAGGADVITDSLFAGFYVLGALSADKCAPFSTRLGTTLAEGAGFVVLERRSAAAARGARERGTLLGYGSSSDAFHETSPDPTGAGIARALTAALVDARIDPSRVGYANLHATGTSANDPAEWRAYQRAFGERAATLPVSGSKSFLGHAQAAAGVLELVVTLHALETGILPQTLHLTSARRGAPPDPVALPHPRRQAVQVAIKSSAAFGGANAALVVGKAGLSSARQTLRRPVWLLGTAQIGLDPHSADARSPDATSINVLPQVDPRSLDNSARWLTTVSALALAAAGVSLRGDVRERTGMVAVVTRPPVESTQALLASIERRGLVNLSASAFARAVPIAPAGACCKQLSIKGPLTTLTIGPASDLLALAYAAEILSTRSDVDLLLAAGLFERSASEARGNQASGPPDEPPSDGAMALVLGASANADSKVRVAGWSIGAPGDETRVAQRALAQAGASGAERFSPGLGHRAAHGAGWGETCVRAERALAEGRVRAVLLCSAEGSASVAVVLTRGVEDAS